MIVELCVTFEKFLRRELNPSSKNLIFDELYQAIRRKALRS